REGVYDQAIEGIREALRRGFRVTTNTTLFDGASAIRMQMFFDEMMELGVEGMMLSPGYSYSKAPDQEHFLRRQKTHELFSKMLSNPKKRWKFNQSPLFLQFLMGKRDFECTPWGNPTYNMFGWQRPCYLLQEGYAATFQELMETTQWEHYGRKSGNEKCRDCMVHCGYEPTAVNHTFASWRGLRDPLYRQRHGGRRLVRGLAPRQASLETAPRHDASPRRVTRVAVFTAVDLEARSLARLLGLTRVAGSEWPHYRSGALELVCVGPRAR